MGWFLRASRSGVHAVYSQQAENSCGIASIMMVNFKMKKWRLAASVASAPASGPVIGAVNVASSLLSAVKSEEQVDEAYSKVSGSRYNGSTYTYATILPKVLNELGIGRWESRCVPSNQLAATIVDKAFARSCPFIMLVHWRSGGGHFVVGDYVTRTGSEIVADFCDPWDGAVRTVPLRRGQNIVYQVANQPGVDFGQAHRTYTSPGAANAHGWIVYQVYS